MRAEVLALFLIVGIATYLMRVLPLVWRGRDAPADPDSLWQRFQAAIGPAAIATLFAASVLPELQDVTRIGPLAVGVAGVLAVWLWRRSVVLATLGGSLAYGVTFALTGAV